MNYSRGLKLSKFPIGLIVYWLIITMFYSVWFSAKGYNLLTLPKVSIMYFFTFTYIGYQFFSTEKIKMRMFLHVSVVAFTYVIFSHFFFELSSREGIEVNNINLALFSFEVSLAQVTKAMFQQIMIFCVFKYLDEKISNKGALFVFTFLLLIINSPLFFIDGLGLVFYIGLNMSLGILFTSIYIYFARPVLYSLILHLILITFLNIYLVFISHPSSMFFL